MKHAYFGAHNYVDFFTLLLLFSSGYDFLIDSLFFRYNILLNDLIKTQHEIYFAWTKLC